jgi:hypothetical protein
MPIKHCLSFAADGLCALMCAIAPTLGSHAYQKIAERQACISILLFIPFLSRFYLVYLSCLFLHHLIISTTTFSVRLVT